ncbi:hypothetical protein [Aureispira sp. CCB-E]|uniref:hypothetical protein n=1 Tax=Aureispira sp. CCB-E TaxID=3051121 RepID=UPI0028690564|nr:hypothetical protein [Aureispira sp. CCB-E]WMX16002.1 hypothetical protein QP953_06445 [Aureispira sp. CCB-E]
MKTRHWNSDIETYQDDSSFSIVCANKHTGWFLTLGYFLLTVTWIALYFGLKLISLEYFVHASIFFIIILYSFLLKTILSVPIGTDCFLSLTDQELTYKFYHLGYTQITHPIRAINKVRLSTNNDFLVFHLYNNRVTEPVPITIEFPKEAARILVEVHTFLEQQGLHLSPPIANP